MATEVLSLTTVVFTTIFSDVFFPLVMSLEDNTVLTFKCSFTFYLLEPLERNKNIVETRIVRLPTYGIVR